MNPITLIFLSFFFFSLPLGWLSFLFKLTAFPPFFLPLFAPKITSLCFILIGGFYRAKRLSAWVEKHGWQHAWLGAVKTAEITWDLAGDCVHIRGSRELMHGTWKASWSWVNNGRRSMGWHQGMAVGELEKKKKKRENGSLPWALVWAKNGGGKWAMLGWNWSWAERNGLG